MDSRQRFKLAMTHQNSDRPPIDIGATTLTSMTPRCQDRLRQFLGFSGAPELTNSGVDERILEWAGTDFRSVGGIIDLPSPHSKVISPTIMVDCWGVHRKKVGPYAEISHSPLKGASSDDLAHFQWPEPRVDDELLARWERDARTLAQENRYVIIGEHPVYGILELGCWMCGYDDFLMRLAGDPDFVRRFFDKVLDIQMQVIEQYYAVLGPYLDLTMSGDDFGMQLGPLLSPKMFDELIAPYFSARIRRTKELMKGYFWHHSCGSVFALLDRLIACGVDILNPVQCSASSMEPQLLKATFGQRLVFWGGVDVQQFLPFATMDEVQQHITELIAIMGRDGGYVIAPAHNMQDDIPPENIVTWVETIHQSSGLASRSSKQSNHCNRFRYSIKTINDSE
ncbi:MAG: methyltransferase [candidate division KSB1 bacterium]|nr:methyltransferase [candidate division KSB1 bacterium]